MSYSGYLIKVGTYTFPLHSIAYESYKVTEVNQDIDSYRDANGVLHRNALAHKLPKIEFETRGNVKNAELATIMSGIQSNYINAIEKSVQLTYYEPETDSYKTAQCYIPDISFDIKVIDGDRNVITYNPIRFAFIGY